MEGVIRKRFQITITLTKTSRASIYETAKQTNLYKDRPALVLRSNFTPLTGRNLFGNTAEVSPLKTISTVLSTQQVCKL